MVITISNSQGLWIGFSLRGTPQHLCNDGIYSVDENVVEQIGQNNKTDCFAGISQEGFLSEVLLNICV